MKYKNEQLIKSDVVVNVRKFCISIQLENINYHLDLQVLSINILIHMHIFDKYSFNYIVQQPQMLENNSSQSFQGKYYLSECVVAGTQKCGNREFFFVDINKE